MRKSYFKPVSEELVDRTRGLFSGKPARVAEIIKSHLAGSSAAVIATPHWGDIAGITCKTHGRPAMDLVLSRLSAFGLQVVPADGDQAVSAALIKLKRLIP